MLANGSAGTAPSPAGPGTDDAHWADTPSGKRLVLRQGRWSRLAQAAHSHARRLLATDHGPMVVVVARVVSTACSAASLARN
jgi:hypothetical protein